MRHTLHFVLMLLLGGATAAAAADVSGAALGAAGEVYQVQSGLYGALFPNGSEVDAATPVLAVDVQRPGADTFRLLVPGTRGTDYEYSPYLFVEKETNGVYLVWDSRPNLIHSQLMLQAYIDGAWSDAIIVSGSDFSRRSAPRFVLTRDTFQQKASDGTFGTHRRTVIHLTWWEETPLGFEVMYSPLLLVDGAYLGWNETFNLSEQTAGGTGTPDTTQDLAQLVPPAIQPGRDSSSLVLGFTNLQTNRLVSVEVRSLSAALGLLAEDLRSFLLAYAPSYMPDRIEALADLVRAHILAVGAQFDPDVLVVIADKARSHIIETGHASPGRPRLLADKARSHIIETGRKLIGRGLREDKSASDGLLVEVARADRTDATDRPVADNVHWLEMRSVSSWPVPVNSGSGSTILLSEDGGEAIVAWQDTDRVVYRESGDGSDWNAQSAIQLSNDLTLDRVFSILERRLRAN